VKNFRGLLFSAAPCTHTSVYDMHKLPYTDSFAASIGTASGPKKQLPGPAIDNSSINARFSKWPK